MNKPTTIYKSFEQLAQDVRGKWSYIFDELAPELAAAMSAAPHHVPCPVHGGTDGFRLFKDFHDTGGGMCNTCGGFRDGFKLLAWLRDWSMKDAVREVGKWDRNESSEVEVRQRPAPKPFVVRDPVAAYRALREVWLTSKEIRGTAAERYLENRGIWRQNIPNTLRFHPGLRYYCKDQKKVIGTFPCLLAPIKDKDGKLLSIHRIYITQDGKKAPVKEPKKMMTPMADLSGSAIKLHDATRVLGVAEGIETALAAHAISRMPVWSCVNTALLKNVIIPDSVELLVIWADKDLKLAGEIAANRLADRLATDTRKVEIYYPDLQIPSGSKGVDWLDAMLTRGLPAFPERWRRWQEQPTRAA